MEWISMAVDLAIIIADLALIIWIIKERKK